MTTSNYRWWGIGLLFLAIAIGDAGLAAAQDDPALQFSPASNPTPADGNGAWSYGYENFPLPNAFNLLTFPAPIGALDSWQSPAFGQVAVIHNGTAANQFYTLGGDNGAYQPDQLGMHPGPNDQYGIVQFIATTPGFYTIQGTFEGLDTSGLCNTFAYLLHNNLPVTPLINVTGFDVPFPASAGPFFLNAGDTLAYAAGGNPAFGSTGLVPGSAFVAPAVPEPSAFALLGLGIVGLFGSAVRRRVAAKRAVN